MAEPEQSLLSKIAPWAKAFGPALMPESSQTKLQNDLMRQGANNSRLGRERSAKLYNMVLPYLGQNMQKMQNLPDYGQVLGEMQSANAWKPQIPEQNKLWR